MKITIVTGGRDYDDRSTLAAALKKSNPTIVVQGGARGADLIADEWAHANECMCLRVPARWASEGRKAAGPLRNHRMLGIAVAIARALGAEIEMLHCPGGTGTAHCVGVAKRYYVELTEVK